MEQIVSSALLGSAMPLTLTWSDLALRLLCTLIAGSLIGYNRGERGKAAGLRTTLLVCMAASIAMLQMNYLLTLSGRGSDSFVTNDLMRLPLGILTGVGFIGGAILRRGNLVVGVTTAATLWYVTVVGLCFGGGRFLLGWAATALGCLVLWVMKWMESCMAEAQHFRLVVTVEAGGPGENEIHKRLAAAAFEMRDVSFAVESGRRTYALVVSRFRPPGNLTIPAVVEELGHAPGVSAVKWTYFD